MRSNDERQDKGKRIRRADEIKVKVVLEVDKDEGSMWLFSVNCDESGL